MVILFVTDQTTSKKFYESILKKAPILDVPGMTEFHLSDNFSVGLMPGDNIKTLLDDKIPNPYKAKGIPRCELYLFVSNPTRHLDLLKLNGGKIVSEVKQRSWGDEVGYGLDPDGHLIAFATTTLSS